MEIRRPIDMQIWASRGRSGMAGRIGESSVCNQPLKLKPKMTISTGRGKAWDMPTSESSRGPRN